MKYMISQMNREVELADELVHEYLKYANLSECEFVMAAISEVGHLPTEGEISDERLSLLCMEVLLNNLQVFQDLPDIFLTLERYADHIKSASDSGVMLEISIDNEETK